MVRIIYKLDCRGDDKRIARYMAKTEGMVRYPVRRLAAFTMTWKSGRRSVYVDLGGLIGLLWEHGSPIPAPETARDFRMIVSQLNRLIDHELVHVFEPTTEQEKLAMRFDTAGCWARNERGLWRPLATAEHDGYHRGWKDAADTYIQREKKRRRRKR